MESLLDDIDLEWVWREPTLSHVSRLGSKFKFGTKSDYYLIRRLLSASKWLRKPKLDTMT